MKTLKLIAIAALSACASPALRAMPPSDLTPHRIVIIDRQPPAPCLRLWWILIRWPLL